MLTDLMCMSNHLASWFIYRSSPQDVRGAGSAEAITCRGYCSSTRGTFSIGNRPEVLSLTLRAACREHVLTLTSVYNLPTVQHPPRQKPMLLWRFVFRPRR